MARRRMTPARTETGGGVAYDALAQALMQRSDFQHLLDQLGNRLRQELLQQLVRQPLQQIGGHIGQDLQQNLFGGGSESFALSDLQFGALLRDLIGDAEKIL